MWTVKQRPSITTNCYVLTEEVYIQKCTDDDDGCHTSHLLVKDSIVWLAWDK